MTSLPLTYLPIEPSMHVYRNGVAMHRSTWTYDAGANAVTTLAAFGEGSGDTIECRYAHHGEVPPPPTSTYVAWYGQFPTTLHFGASPPSVLQRFRLSQPVDMTGIDLQLGPSQNIVRTYLLRILRESDLAVVYDSQKETINAAAVLNSPEETFTFIAPLKAGVDYRLEIVGQDGSDAGAVGLVSSPHTPQGVAVPPTVGEGTFLGSGNTVNGWQIPLGIRGEIGVTRDATENPKWHVRGEDAAKWVSQVPRETFSEPGIFKSVKPGPTYRWPIMRRRVDGGAWDAGGWYGNANNVGVYPLTEQNTTAFSNTVPVNPMYGHEVEIEVGWSTLQNSPATWAQGIAAGVSQGVLTIWKDPL